MDINLVIVRSVLSHSAETHSLSSLVSLLSTRMAGVAGLGSVATVQTDDQSCGSRRKVLDLFVSSSSVGFYEMQYSATDLRRCCSV